MEVISEHINQIIQLCKLNNVKALFVFGSVTTNKFRPDSNIDLVVDIDDYYYEILETIENP